MALNFAEAMRASTADDTRSLYYRANNQIDGVLVVQSDTDATELVKNCFDTGFRVSVDSIEDDYEVPRLETVSDEYIGEEAIREFLASRDS